MKIKIAVDATPIVSALIGGVSRSVLFNRRFEFISTEYTFEEVKKYTGIISKKSGVSADEVRKALNFLPIRVYPKKHYKKDIQKANKIIGKIDKKDADILALGLKEKCHIWSEDKDFRNNKEIMLIRTKDLI
ncbi:hypothetical protein HYT24_00185 [Candidatus Pacearchaeota archaeon]|nr:hypothetical protein [Candidatus Pacearchaeota archaeon]